MNIYLVRVTTDDQEHRVWAAATSREEAVDRVLDRVPEGWTARLMEDHGDAGQDGLYGMKPGELRELSASARA
jgi:hypothetical protein